MGGDTYEHTSVKRHVERSLEAAHGEGIRPTTIPLRVSSILTLESRGLVCASTVLMRTLFRSKRGDSLLLIGPSGAGKTALFLQLTKGNLGQGTVTSLKANEGTATLPGLKAPVKTVDLPGHTRLRGLTEKRLSSARAVVFVLDSVEVSGASYVRGAADMLYDVLGNPTVQKSRVPVLVACNKMDLSSAHTAEFTRKRLEKEMEILRGSRASMQDTTTARKGGGGGAAAVSIGKLGQPFAFATCANAVTCAATSVLQNELKPVYEFLESSY